MHICMGYIQVSKAIDSRRNLTRVDEGRNSRLEASRDEDEGERRGGEGGADPAL